ncbi:S26 family signal peptidase [Halosolutus amylolyticus]|uniref:S26 family signal peptidase n=1 Tax=Halosolutus amylolyticus TaxID=2932267 RepID=A0ABD5PJN2_9EURY|nr:S26 family signal peptidase [Halosolutus amylolyticus]
MSGPDSGDSADDGHGDDAPDTRDEPPSDGTDAPDETHAKDTSTRSSDDSTRRTDGTSNRTAGDETDSTGDSAVAGSNGDRDATVGTAANTGDRGDGDAVTIEDDGVIRWFLNTDDGTVVFARDVLSSVAIVAVVGLLLFGVSGIWPPLVAVESGSMEPNMERGDLVFVVDDDRFVGDGSAAGTGVVTLDNGQESDHEKFGNPGDVIVFRPDGTDHRTPIIHRAHFYVEEGENWVTTQANPSYLNGNDCNDIRSCPAPHDGFVTKGDANYNYDQVGLSPKSSVVKPEWVTGKAMFRIPWLGHVRLTFDTILGGTVTTSPTIVGASPAGAGPAATGTPAVGAASAGVAGVAATGVTAAVAVSRRRF